MSNRVGHASPVGGSMSGSHAPSPAVANYTPSPGQAHTTTSTAPTTASEFSDHRIATSALDSSLLLLNQSQDESPASTPNSQPDYQEQSVSNSNTASPTQPALVTSDILAQAPASTSSATPSKPLAASFATASQPPAPVLAPSHFSTSSFVATSRPPSRSFPAASQPSPSYLSEPSVSTHSQPTPTPPIAIAATAQTPVETHPRSPAYASRYTPQYQQSSARPSPELYGHPSKPPIMDPPSNKHRQGSSNSFPSPTMSQVRVNPKFSEDQQRMNFAVSQSLPNAVRRAIRDNWEKCLLGSEFHQAFVLNASIHHTSGPIIRRSIADFGPRMISEARDELMNLFTADDIDIVAQIILDRASDNFLDKALVKRLHTIEARPLVNALANAGRLGYEPSDVVENNGERVIPTQPTSKYAAQPVDNSQWNCTICGKHFIAETAYQHHVFKRVCQKEPPSANGFPYSCSFCGQGFTTVVGLQYHNANKVCGDFGQPIKIPKDGMISAEPTNGSPTHFQTPTNSSQKASRSRLRSVSQPQHISRSAPTRHTPPTVGSILPTKVSGTSYDHLEPHAREALVEDLRQAEILYGERIKQTEQIADPETRLARLEGLKNSFSTKQSMIRKKYGVRLRERRSKAQMEEERRQLGIQTASMMSNSAIQRAMEEISANGGNPAQFMASEYNRRASGWTAANNAAPHDEDSHSDKRQRTAGGSTTTAFGFSQRDSSRRRAGIAVTEMVGGLGGSSATAATKDPTLLLENGGGTTIPTQGRTMASMKAAGARVSGGTTGVISKSVPTAIKTEPSTIDSDEDEESSDDDDIPADLP